MKRAGLITKILVFAVIAFLVWTIADSRRDIAALTARYEEIKAQSAALELENDEMRRQIENADTDETKAEIARDQLDLMMPGEEVIQN